MNIYHIYAYKHFWTGSALDPNSLDIPVPYMKDSREYVIEAENETAAIAKAEQEYGSGQRVENGKYVLNSDGSWTLMGVTRVEIPA